MTPPSTRQGRPRGAAWLALGTLAALAALALALGAQPLRAFIEARVQDAIRAQVVWQPDSPKQTAGVWAAGQPPWPWVGLAADGGRRRRRSARLPPARVLAKLGTRRLASLPPAIAARFGDNTDPAMPPLTSTFRFLNITNVADVRAGAKPILVRCFALLWGLCLLAAAELGLACSPGDDGWRLRRGFEGPCIDSCRRRTRSFLAAARGWALRVSEPEGEDAGGLERRRQQRAVARVPLLQVGAETRSTHSGRQQAQYCW